MSKVYENIKVYDGLDSEVAVAPKGTTLPEGIGPSEAPFAEVGWISEDGISEEAESSVETRRAWQGRKVVKRFIPEADATFTIQCLEENAVTYGLKTRGAETTVTSGVAKTIRNKETALDERVWRLRSIADDGSETVQVFVGMHSLNGTIQRTATEMTIYEYQLNPVGDVIEYTDNAAIVAGATVTVP